MAGHAVVVLDFASFSVTDLRGWFRKAGNRYGSMHGIVRATKKLMQGNVNGH